MKPSSYEEPALSARRRFLKRLGAVCLPVLNAGLLLPTGRRHEPVFGHEASFYRRLDRP